MNKFNPANKDILTFQEALEPALIITGVEEANQFFNDYVAYIRRWSNPPKSVDRAQEVARHNIGVFACRAPIYVHERVWKLFGAKVPEEAITEVRMRDLHKTLTENRLLQY